MCVCSDLFEFVNVLLLVGISHFVVFAEVTVISVSLNYSNVSVFHKYVCVSMTS